MLNEFLPIGSVVLLKGAKKRLMICGRLQVEASTQKLFDYSGCLYPEGIIDIKEMYLFQQEDIERVYFIGLQDEEEFSFRNYIMEQMEKTAQEQENSKVDD